MSAGSFIRHRRTLFHEGRRYVVRGPTYATVWTLLSSFPGVLAGMASAHLRKPGCVTVEAALVLFPFVDRDRRLVDVLGTCVETDADPSTWPLRDLAVAMLGLCDLEAIVGSLDLVSLSTTALEEEGPAAPVEADDRDGELAILRLASMFGCSPDAVMDWPYEAVVSAVELLPDMVGGEGSRRKSERGADHSPEFLKLVREMGRSEA